MVNRFRRYKPINHSMSVPPPRASADLNEPPIQPMKRPRHHGRFFWTEICWRLTATLIFSIVITVILYSFSLKGVLSRWEKRWFNALAILFSSLVSLSTGSLLGLLGSMLRWPLLAHKLHTPTDVDLILGMPNPTGAFRLIWTHTIHKRKWCIATAVVMGYLLVNIIGRLSVAVFGLTFDLNEQLGIEYPTRVTNWDTNDWFDDSMLASSSSSNYSSRYDFLDQNLRRMNCYATIGLSNVPDGDFDSKNLSTYNVTNINGHGLNRVVGGDNAAYSYYLKEYHGDEVSSSKTEALHSSSICIGRFVSSSEHEQMVGDPYNNDTLMNVRNIISRVYQYPQDDIIWTAPLNYEKLYEESACETTYLYAESYLDVEDQGNRNAVLFECYTCTNHNNSIPGFGLLESPHSKTFNVSNILHRIGSFDRVWSDDVRDYTMRTYSGMNKNEHFANYLNNAIKKDGDDIFNPKHGIPPEANLHAAHLTARLPLLAILGADIQIPKVTRIPGASERRFVDVRLKVELNKTIAVLVCLFAGQILAIGVVLFYCRKVFIRDYASSFSIARLLKTTMEGVEGMSTQTGDEISRYLEHKGVMMRYGVRWKDDTVLEVGLWNDVVGKFPDAMYG